MLRVYERYSQNERGSFSGSTRDSIEGMDSRDSILFEGERRQSSASTISGSQIS